MIYEIHNSEPQQWNGLEYGVKEKSITLKSLNTLLRIRNG